MEMVGVTGLKPAQQQNPADYPETMSDCGFAVISSTIVFPAHRGNASWTRSRSAIPQRFRPGASAPARD